MIRRRVLGFVQLHTLLYMGAQRMTNAILGIPYIRVIG